MQYILITVGVLFPFLWGYLLLRKNGALSVTKYNFVVFGVLALLVTAGALWPHIHRDFLLLWYGYDFGGVSMNDRLIWVDPSLHAELRILTTKSHGVGWPVQAILAIVYYVIPYQVIILLWPYVGLLTHRRITL